MTIPTASESSDSEGERMGEEEEQEVCGSEEEESKSEETNDVALDASDTESDEDDDESNQGNSESGEEEQHKKDTPKTRADVETEKIIQKYQGRRGKQLYVRFPKRLPDNEEEFQQLVKRLSPKVIKAHKPRQKHARFCLVDFNTKEERDATLKDIKKASKSETDFKGIVVSIPRTESENFINELVTRKVQSLENKKAKKRLKRETKKALRTKNFTSSVVLLNLPKNTSMLEVRTLFPNAVDVQMKALKNKLHGNNMATITLPTTQDARTAVKKPLSLNGTKLIVRFDRQQMKHKKPNSKGIFKTAPPKDKKGESEEETIETPAPAPKKLKMGVQKRGPPEGVLVKRPKNIKAAAGKSSQQSTKKLKRTARDGKTDGQLIGIKKKKVSKQ